VFNFVQHFAKKSGNRMKNDADIFAGKIFVLFMLLLLLARLVLSLRKRAAETDHLFSVNGANSNQQHFFSIFPTLSRIL